MSAKDRARILEKEMQCNCDLDNWQPEPSTGHSWVCRIHKAAIEPTNFGRLDEAMKSKPKGGE